MNMHSKICKSLLLVFTVLVIALLITGCISVDVNSDLKFCRSGDWYVDMDVIATSYDINRGPGVWDADSQVDEIVRGWDDKGGDWSWKRTSDEGNYIWHITGEGRTIFLKTETVASGSTTALEKISILGDNAQVTLTNQVNERVIHIIGRPNADFNIDQFNFSITGGEIISSNANYVEKNTAHWDLSPSKQIEITFTEGWCWEPYRYWILGVFIAILLIGIGIWIFILVRKQRQVQSLGIQPSETQSKPTSHIQTTLAKFYLKVRSTKMRYLLNPALIGIFTWSWIAGGVVAIVAIVQSVYTQCTWLISTFGGMQFLGCSSSTDTTIFIFYLGLEFGATGFAGCMGTFAGKSLKSGAKAGALAIFIPSLAEGIASLIDMGSSAFPLSCISLPLSLIMSVAFGAFIGTIGGWIGLEISRRKKSNEPPVLDELKITDKWRTVYNEDEIMRGDKIVIQAAVGDLYKARGIRLYMNDHLLQESYQSRCSFEVDTTKLSPGKYTFRVDAAGINDAGWSNPSTKQQILIVSEGGRNE
jgi:hypothetical protein